LTRPDTGKITFPWEAPPEFGAPLTVADRVHWMRLPLPMALDHVNAWIFEDDDGLTLVDPGIKGRRTQALWQAALADRFAGQPVTRVLVTHHHPDHIGLAGWFQAEHGAELLMSRTAWLMARMLTLDVQDRPTAETARFWQRAGMDAQVHARRLAERPFNFADVVAPLPLGYRRLVEGGTITLAGRLWDIRMGDGHAPEHVTLWSRGGDLVLGGDQLLASISPNLGLYATEPGADPVGDWLAACERLAPYATPGQLVLPGHKLPFTGLPKRLRQMADNHHGALDRLAEFLAEPHSATDCFQVLFKRDIGAGEYGLALVEAVAHCQHLWLTGRATRHDGPQGEWRYQAARDAAELVADHVGDLLEDPATQRLAEQATQALDQATQAQQQAEQALGKNQLGQSVPSQQASAAALARAAQALRRLGQAVRRQLAQNPPAPATPSQPGQPNEDFAGQLAEAYQATQNAGQSQAEMDAERAARLLAALARQAGQQAQAMGIMPMAGMPGMPGMPGMSLESTMGVGFTGVDARTGALIELGIAPADWTRLPGRLRDQVLQAARRSAPAEYRGLIKRYFQAIAKRGARGNGKLGKDDK